VPDHGRLLLEPADHLGEVVGHLADRLAGEHLGVRPRLSDGFGIIRPPRRQCREAGLLEDGGPALPAAGQQPEAVDEDDRRPVGRVGAFDLIRGGTGAGC
jgi:hypothetical protein